MMNKSPFFASIKGNTGGNTLKAFTPKGQQVPNVPDYMKKGAVFYHVTQKSSAESIMTKGPGIMGNVKALGPGFYTVKELAKVWQWMHFDANALNERKTDDERKKILSEKCSVIVIEIETVPTKVWDGPSADAEVIVRSGDIAWTETGIKLVKVIEQITGETMLSNSEFIAWYDTNLKIKKKVENKVENKVGDKV
ncbi:hypothetical protein ABW20_dc0101245 [Dactylellina cionopaga]|nr:hypothetical protein ABW20_dc0101245 [Dactylellina cionopaga]